MIIYFHTYKCYRCAEDSCKTLQLRHLVLYIKFVPIKWKCCDFLPTVASSRPTINDTPGDWATITGLRPLRDGHRKIQ